MAWPDTLSPGVPGRSGCPDTSRLCQTLRRGLVSLRVQAHHFGSSFCVGDNQVYTMHSRTSGFLFLESSIYVQSVLYFIVGEVRELACQLLALLCALRCKCQSGKSGPQQRPQRGWTPRRARHRAGLWVLSGKGWQEKIHQEAFAPQSPVTAWIAQGERCWAPPYPMAEWRCHMCQLYPTLWYCEFITGRL